MLQEKSILGSLEHHFDQIILVLGVTDVLPASHDVSELSNKSNVRKSTSVKGM